MKKGFLKLIISIIIASLPLLLLIVFYVITDPFKILHCYSSYYKNDVVEIPINRDFASTEIFLMNHEKYSYDSFIFGSSRSLAFLCSDLTKHINCSAFHYDANGESLFGVLGKLKLLQKKNVKINNCIIVLDSALALETKNSTGHTYIKHPLVSNESPIKFQYTFLSTYLSNNFFIPFICSKLHIQLPKKLEYPDIFDIRTFEYNNINNDITFSSAEKEIAENPIAFFSKDTAYFNRADPGKIRNYQQLIRTEQKEEFNEVKLILEKNNTKVIIIIYPDYNQVYFNQDDINFLKNLFGSANIYDFSGINKYTNDKKNYYDLLHCRSSVGKDILDRIYTNSH